MKKFLSIMCIIAMLISCICFTGCESSKKKAEDTTVDPLEKTAETVELTEAQKAFEGDWYGWWAVYEPEGSEYLADGDCYDTCARISFDTDGSCKMEIWDEVSSSEQPICITDLIVNSDGTASSGEGSFMKAPLEKYSWYITPAKEGIEGLLYIDGSYSYEGVSYDYEIFLKKWGEDWEDVPEKLHPAYLKTWYLPLIEANKEMPASIELTGTDNNKTGESADSDDKADDSGKSEK